MAAAALVTYMEKTALLPWDKLSVSKMRLVFPSILALHLRFDLQINNRPLKNHYLGGGGGGDVFWFYVSTISNVWPNLG